MRGYSAIGLIGAKIEANVGGALRAAFCYNASLIILQAPRFKQQSTNVFKTERHIPLIVGNILECRPYDCEIVAVELVENCKSLVSFKHPQRAIYVFGPEDGSISPKFLEKAQHVVQIPTVSCMNLAATVNVVLYDRLAKN